jgi:hypothetical protein
MQTALKNIHVREGFNVRGVLPEIPKLAEDIAERGLLEPLSVRAIFSPPISQIRLERFEIVFGHRRYAALRLLQEQNRSVVMRPGPYNQIVNDSFQVSINVIEMSDEDAYLANLAENAHKEGMRRVDVLSRSKELVDSGTPIEKVASASGISVSTMTQQLSIARRLAPEIWKRWRMIERPEHEPPWKFLEELVDTGRRIGRTNGRGSELRPPPLTSVQIARWTKLYAETDGKVIRVGGHKRTTSMRGVVEIRAKLRELQQKDPIEQDHGKIAALVWVLGHREEL